MVGGEEDSFNPRGLAKSIPDPRALADHAVWTARYASLTFTRTAYQFPWTGMNEAGLILSTMGLDVTQVPPPDQRPPLDSGLWMQYVLDNCASIDEVIATDDDVRMAFSVDHYLVADRHGTAAVEFIGGERVVHWGPDLPIAVLSNTVYSVGRDNWTAYLNHLPWLSANESVNRFVSAGAAVAAFQPSSSEQAVLYAFSILGDVGGGNSSQSFVYDAEHGRVYYRTLANPEVRFIDFHAFDPDCSSPVQMLDVTIPLEDIMTHFASFPCSTDPTARRDLTGRRAYGRSGAGAWCGWASVTIPIRSAPAPLATSMARTTSP